MPICIVCQQTRSANAGLMLGQRRKRGTNIKLVVNQLIAGCLMKGDRLDKTTISFWEPQMYEHFISDRRGSPIVLLRFRAVILYVSYLCVTIRPKCSLPQGFSMKML